MISLCNQQLQKDQDVSLQTNITNSEEFLQNILNAIPISIIVIDRDYNIVAMNGHAKASHSRSNDSPAPNKCYHFSHHQNTPCESDDHICPHKKVLETHEIVKVQHIHFDEHNNQQTVEITAIPILDKLNEVEYVIEIANDISKQVSVEAALQSVFIGTSTGVGTDFFKSLVANLASELNVKYALVGELTDLRKIQTHAVWTGNGFTDNFTYDLENTPCQNVIETSICSYPEDIQILFPKDELLSEMNAVGYIGAPLTDSDGHTNGILAVLDTKPLKNEKLSKKLLSVFAARAGAELGRKISEKKQLDLEMKLNHAQKMDSIGTLAGGIAHDFNNILSAIIGYSELSLPNVTEGTLLHSNIAKILDAGNRAKDLVQQILTFSRQSSPQVLTVNVKTIAVEVLKFIKATLPSYIEIQANYYGDPIVKADPSQIHQVIMNLCTNAGYAMADQGGVF